MYSIIHLRSALPPPSSMPSSMDSSTAGGSAATGRTVGGRSVNFSGCRGRPPKKPLFGRDDRLARDGARLMTGHFRPPALLLLPAAPTAASTSILAAVGRPASPPPVAAVAASATLISPSVEMPAMTAMTVASVLSDHHCGRQGTRARPPSSASRRISCPSCRIN